MRVWTGSFISGTGDEITLLALPWLMLQITHSPFQLGIVAALQNLPFLLLTLIAGVYADRWDRRRIMLSADILRFASLVTIPIAALFGVLTVLQIYVVAFLAGTGRVWFDVAHYALLPGIVEREQLVDANSKFQTSDGVSVLLGPSIGGFLIKLAGAANAIALDAVSFLVSATAIFTLPSLRGAIAG
jgi:MFS family permease